MLAPSCSPYEVVIVGGRPAGASLAARLGARGLRVLVLDRATFPSEPAVPSCAVLYGPAMRELDDLGVPESSYAHATSRLADFRIEFDGRFHVEMTLPDVFGRRYAVGLCRARFDEVLWRNLAKYPSVTAIEGFSVDELARDASGRVIGVQGTDAAGAPRAFFADICVVGADGRYSLVARKVGAKVTADFAKTSTVYFAEWEGLKPSGAHDRPTFHVLCSGRGKNILFIPTVDGRVHVATHVRSDRVDVGGDAQAYYMAELSSFAAARRRVDGARQAGPVFGAKRIANRYIEHGGPGWALAGDALHHKDPVDGQGIYDALLSARLLAAEIIAVREQGLPWEAALASYQRSIAEATEPMFRASMKRIQTELYEEPPPIVISTLVRWLLSDPEYQRRFFLFLGRSISPSDWLPPSLIAKAALRGAARDVARIARRALGAH